MSKANDGGPAFPRPGYGGVSGTEQGGMSLRDWFAGQAMAAIISKLELGREFVGDPESEAWRKLTQDCVANGAYLYADAMLAQRNGGAA